MQALFNLRINMFREISLRPEVAGVSPHAGAALARAGALQPPLLQPEVFPDMSAVHGAEGLGEGDLRLEEGHAPGAVLGGHQRPDLLVAGVEHLLHLPGPAAAAALAPGLLSHTLPPGHTLVILCIACVVYLTKTLKLSCFI